MGPKPKSQVERFWPKVHKGNGCWVWLGSVMKGGYGKFMWDNKRKFQREIGAHRASWLLTGKYIPPGHDVCHSCDNPRCVRPDHLFVGTRKDNMQDAVKKGRQLTVPLKGIANGRATITDDDVRQIRCRASMGENHKALAAEYRMTKENIRMIVHRKTWSHI